MGYNGKTRSRSISKVPTGNKAIREGQYHIIVQTEYYSYQLSFQWTEKRSKSET